MVMVMHCKRIKYSFGYDYIGDVSASYLSSAASKETKLSEESNSDNRELIDAVKENQPQTLPQSTTDSLPTDQISVAEKAKKKKTKNKKRSEKIESAEGSTGDGVPRTESDSAAYQLPSPVLITEEVAGAGKRSKKIRHEGQVVRSEDVDGYCGSLPVDDLIKFIDCSHKLWRRQSQTDAGSLTEVEKLQSVKKESARDTAVENDSGFGDVEVPDRTDASHSDDALSPSVSSVSESVEIVVELLSDSLNPAANQSTAETREENLVDDACEVPASAPPDWSVDSELSFAAAFLSDEEFRQPEPEFIVVRQKKRRTKGQKMDAVNTDKPGCSLVGPLPSQSSSMVCSSASSERSNSPQSVAAVNEFTVSGRLSQQVSDAQGNTSSFRRFNSEIKWQARHSRFNHSPDTTSEFHPVRARTHTYGYVSGRSTSGGKNFPSVASSQRREMGKLKDRKCNLSYGITHGSQLPDVVLNAERPRQADRPHVSPPTKVMMQDAHCQTVDDNLPQSPDPDSCTDTSQTCVPFDLLTLQLFMYHG